MLNSYNNINGNDTMVRVNGSPVGVITAANITIATIACL